LRVPNVNNSSVKNAVVYAVVERGEDPKRLGEEVSEKRGFKVLKVFVDWEDTVARRNAYPRLSELLTSITRGDLTVDAVVVPTIKVFPSLEVFLFVKKFLSMHSIDLVSLKRGEKTNIEVELERLKRNVRRSTLIDVTLYAFIWAASIYLGIILHDLILDSFILATVVFTGVMYFRKTYRLRRRMIKLLEELEKLRNIKGRKNVRFKVMKSNVEVIEVPY
jgi:hypothetical protein